MPDQAAEGIFSPYLRKKRLQKVAPYLQGKVLDFGCGTGGLATLVDHEQYLGVDRDQESIDQAQRLFPHHRFLSHLPQPSQPFDTVVALAVIEHTKEPVEFLKTLLPYLADTPLAHIVLTTPHPCMDWVHTLGAKMGLFSKAANEEHEALLDQAQLESIAQKVGLKLKFYARFLFGANQIVAFCRKQLP